MISREQLLRSVPLIKKGLDTREYELELEDGSTEIYSSNIIMENIYTQVDDESRMFVLMDEIIDHKEDDSAIPISEGTFISNNSVRKKRTTRGWKLLVQWKDGTTSWARLADMKESFPLETAEYARRNQIAEEPAFAWWVPTVLRKRASLICKAKTTKYWLKTHKYGIRLPHSVEEALKIDAETNTRFWRDAIEKEMKNVMVAFEFNDDDEIPVGHTELFVHMVFDVKITLQQKARLVADG